MMSGDDSTMHPPAAELATPDEILPALGAASACHLTFAPAPTHVPGELAALRDALRGTEARSAQAAAQRSSDAESLRTQLDVARAEASAAREATDADRRRQTANS